MQVTYQCVSMFLCFVHSFWKIEYILHSFGVYYNVSHKRVLVRVVTGFEFHLKALSLKVDSTLENDVGTRNRNTDSYKDDGNDITKLHTIINFDHYFEIR